MFILLLGAPGSGKGTQGKILAERLGLPKITTGEILRAAVKGQTPLGLEAKKFMDDGKLVPDSVVLGMIKEELVRRMLGRAAQEGRSDDTPDAIKMRQQVYQRDTAPLIAHYAERGIVKRVPGVGTVDEIAMEIKRVIGR